MPLLSLVVVAALLAKQDIPKGVVYKKAPDALNKIALQKLHDLFDGDPTRTKLDFAPLGAKVVICMPGMWSNIQSSFMDHTPRYMRNAPKAKYVMPSSSGVQSFEGRLLKTDQSQGFLWNYLLLVRRHEKPTLRKANADELKYYWAMIAYDIEEPVYVADFGNHHAVLFDFDSSKTDPRIWVVEMIGTMKQ